MVGAGMREPQRTPTHGVTPACCRTTNAHHTSYARLRYAHQPSAPSMAQRAWMTSTVRKRLKVSGSADRPEVSQP